MTRSDFSSSDYRNDKTGVNVDVGLSPLDMVHIDITRIGGTGSNTYGVVAQLNFTF